MKRKHVPLLASLLILAVACLFFVYTTRADDDCDNQHTQKFGPFAATSPDSGTCGNNWAEDSYIRTDRVNPTPNPDGTYSVREIFRDGAFVSIAGLSPGSCETGSKGKRTIAAGINGEFAGFRDLIVSGGTFNPNAQCTTDPNTGNNPCSTTKGFVATVFGPTATYTFGSFSFKYKADNASDSSQWKNASPDKGDNHGDICCTPTKNDDDCGDDD